MTANVKQFRIRIGDKTPVDVAVPVESPLLALRLMDQLCLDLAKALESTVALEHACGRMAEARVLRDRTSR